MTQGLSDCPPRGLYEIIHTIRRRQWDLQVRKHCLLALLMLLCLDDVDQQLMDVAKIASCPCREKYVCLLMDEMHIKSDLVYDKHTGKLIVSMLY